MIDFHSHILPGVDDGSRDVDTSLKMLSISKEGGVDTVVLTPHCHPRSQEHIDAFLEGRDSAFKTLSVAINDKEFPKLVPASEIRIYQDLHKYNGLERLCISGTSYILLEMPYEIWKDYAFEEIYQLTRLGFKPIMAHLDRFLDQEKHFREIFSRYATSVDYALNDIVIKCMAGMASSVCVALDAMYNDMMLGTIAGDDTIFIVTRSEAQAGMLTNELKKMM